MRYKKKSLPVFVNRNKKSVPAKPMSIRGNALGEKAGFGSFPDRKHAETAILRFFTKQK